MISRGKLWWVDTRDMVADGLNKGAVPRLALQELARKGHWLLQHDSKAITHAQALKAARDALAS